MSTIKEAIENVGQLCKGRMDYNLSLLVFFQNGQEEEIRTRVDLIYGVKTKEAYPDLNAFRKMWVEAIRGDIESYQELLGYIKKNTSDSSIVDALYCKLARFQWHERHQRNQQVIKTGKKLSAKVFKKQQHEKFEELPHIVECIGIIQKYVSQGQMIFNKEMGLYADDVMMIPIPKSNHSVRWQEFSKLLITVTKKGMDAQLIEQLHRVNAIRETFESLEKKTDIINRLQKNQSTEILMLQEDEKEIYKEIVVKTYESLSALKRLDAEMTQIIKQKKADNVTFIETQKFEMVKKLRETEQTQIAELAISPSAPAAAGAGQSCLEHTVEVAEQGYLKSIRSEGKASEEASNVLKYKEEQKKKIETYKLEIEASRLAKEKESMEELKLPKINYKVAIDMVESSENQDIIKLLSQVNKRNLKLIEMILDKTCPANQIPFSAIENLIGTEPGKLMGTISGGAHKKIVIGGTIGFYDDYSKLEMPRTIGSGWDAHGGQHASKLPIMALKLLRSTFNRAGITLEMFKEFLSALKTLKINTGNAIQFKELLNCIAVLKSRQYKMPLLMGIYYSSKVAVNSESALNKVLYVENPESSPFVKYSADQKKKREARQILDTIFDLAGVSQVTAVQK